MGPLLALLGDTAASTRTETWDPAFPWKTFPIVCTDLVCASNGAGGSGMEDPGGHRPKPGAARPPRHLPVTFPPCLPTLEGHWRPLVEKSVPAFPGKAGRKEHLNQELCFQLFQGCGSPRHCFPPETTPVWSSEDRGADTCRGFRRAGYELPLAGSGFAVGFLLMARDSHLNAPHCAGWPIATVLPACAIPAASWDFG